MAPLSAPLVLEAHDPPYTRCGHRAYPRSALSHVLGRVQGETPSARTLQLMGRQPDYVLRRTLTVSPPRHVELNHTPPLAPHFARRTGSSGL